MKKFIKSLFITIGILVVLILVAAILGPIIFKEQLKEVAKTQINKNINAQVDFKDLKISFFKGFPQLYIDLQELSVVGIEEFENDTLVSFSSFSVKVNALSPISKNFVIKSIILDEPTINAIKTEEGLENWDIAKPSEVEEEEEEADTTSAEPVDMKVSLKNFEIRNANIFYTDDSTDMSASLEGYNFKLSGDLSQDFTTIKIGTNAEKVNFKMDGIKYVKDLILNIAIVLDADLKNNSYTLKDNSFAFNELVLNLEGNVSMPDTVNTDIDIKFNTEKTTFKSLLSMVPAIYLQDFEDVETDGTLALYGSIKGTMNDEVMPSANINLKVENARFQYPDLPESAENIQIDIDAFYDGEEEDNTTVDINQIHVELAENPFDIHMKLRTLMSDPRIDGTFKGKIDLSTLGSVVPLDDMSITGLVNADIELGGNLSMIEDEKYEEFKADGVIELTDIEYTSEDLPPAKISKALLLFSPQFVDLQKLDAFVGESDFHLKGKMENFIPYVLSDGTIKGNFTFSSNYINVDEFIGESSEEETVEEEEETTETATTEVPDNIDFSLHTSLDKVKYDKLMIDNVKGFVYLKDSRAVLDNLSMFLLKGSLALNGEYNTQVKNEPKVDLGLNLKNIDIPSAFEALNSVQEFAPVAENCTGNISLNLDFTSLLDKKMSPVLESVEGVGSFSSKNIVITNAGALKKIGEKLNSNKFDRLALKNLSGKFEIENGRVYFKEPLETSFGKNELSLTGDQGLDQTMNYNIDLIVPRSELGSAANGAINSLTEQASKNGLNIPKSDNLFVNAIVTGTFGDPKVSLNLKESATDVVNDIKEQAVEKVKDEINKQVNDVKEKASAEAEKIIKEAENKAKQVKAAAKKSADAVRKEADINYNRAMAEVKKLPKIAQAPGKTAADKTKKTAYDKAAKMEKDAAREADGIVAAAKEKADKLK